MKNNPEKKEKSFSQKSSFRQSGSRGGPMGAGIPVQKPKDFKCTLLKSKNFIKPHIPKFLIVFILAAFSTVFSVAGPKILGMVTTSIADSLFDGTGINFDYIGRIILILVVLYLLSSLFAYMQQHIMAGVSQKVVYDLRKETDRKLTCLPLKFYDSKTHGEILSRVTNDVDLVSSALQQSITQIITSLVTLIGIFIMMLTISPVLTLVAVFTVPVSLVITISISKRTQKFFKGQQRNLGELNGHVEEMYGGYTIIKAFGQENKAKAKFADINDDLYENSLKAQFFSGTMMPILRFISNIGYVLICIIGGIFVIQGRVAIGGIQAFIQYSRQFSQPIIQTSQIANVIQSTVAAAERIFEILEYEEEVRDSDDSKSINEILAKNLELENHGIDFKNVRFGYSKDKILMKNLSFNAPGKSTVATVGPTGAGKTTLVNLLMRFYEIESGEILINNIPIKSLTKSSLRKNFGMVLQDTWLFKGTIRENIAYGCEGADEKQIIKAAEIARAHHFIRTLPEGYDTVINEEGSNISAGEKQLLTIARAFLADPKMLILDEATSSVDTRTELLIQKGMAELMKDRTSFVIAHRLSTIIDADLILVMHDGDIIEKGTHKQLMAESGFYADLYNSQFEGKTI